MLLLSYFPCDSSFTLTQFLVYGSFRWLMYHLISSSIILCLSSEGINLSLSIYFSFASEFFFGEVFETFVTLSAILLAVKSPVAFDVF